MLIKHDVLAAIRQGTIDLQFRRWRRPTVKAGGTLHTAVGLLEILSVDAVRLDDVTPAEARRAGFRDVAALSAWLDTTRSGTLYRIRVRYAGRDPRIALRQQADLDPHQLEAIARKLDAMDARSTIGPWTRTAMELIARHPGRLAEELAHEMGLDKHPFKARIRKLKALGLTESLPVGYRLSPRGERVHRFRART